MNMGGILDSLNPVSSECWMGGEVIQLLCEAKMPFVRMTIARFLLKQKNQSIGHIVNHDTSGDSFLLSVGCCIAFCIYFI